MERLELDKDVRANQMRDRCPFNQPHSLDGSLMHWGYHLDVATMIDADVEEEGYVPTRQADRNAPAPLPNTVAARV